MKASHQLIHSIEPLLRVCLSQAERHGLNEIRISKARAQEILQLAVIAKKEMDRPNKGEPRFFSRLDEMVGANP